MKTGLQNIKKQLFCSDIFDRQKRSLQYKIRQCTGHSDSHKQRRSGFVLETKTFAKVIRRLDAISGSEMLQNRSD